MINIKKEQFYKLLQDTFTGAKVQGEGGFINLLRIKENYYKKVFQQFQKEVEQERKGNYFSDFEEEFFDKLYTFFERYFSESGSIYFCKTAYGQKIYEQVYTDNKDVILFWKTQMLYYVKSEVLYKNMEVILEKNGSKFYFFFDVENLEHKKNNDKKKLIYQFVSEEKKDAKRFLILAVTYSKNGSKTGFEELAKSIKKNTSIEIEEDFIQDACKNFERQSEVDYFINKDAKTFLKEQLNFYLHRLLLQEENKFNEKRLSQLKIFQNFALKIIDFISQFENELVKIWNKPKFVKNSNYVITADKINSKLLTKIQTHEGYSKQQKEWQELGIEEKSPTVPLDTKYFKSLEDEILSQFDNLEAALDGRLIHSENYQALNTLATKYKEKVQCIYIDPPFNTGNDFSYIDKYQDSTWLSLMDSRIEIAKKFLKNDGSFFLHLDDNANDYGKIIVKKLFSEIVEVIFNTNATKDNEADLFGYKSFSENFTLKHQTIFFCRNKNYKYNKLWKPNRNTTKLSIGWLDLIAKTKIEKPKKIKDFDYFIEYWEKNKLTKKKIGIDEKIFPIGDIWNDIFSFTQSEMRISESFAFSSSQKPENLIRRIFQSTTDKKDIILDFFYGLGTSIAVAHKLNRKYLGIESGQHFKEIYIDKGIKKLGALGRMKWVLNGDKKMIAVDKPRRPHLSKDINWEGGGFFQYYELEQYEETLSRVKYKEYPKEKELWTQDRKTFEEYIFFADQKLAQVLEMKKDSMRLDFEKLYKNIDLAETLANLYGLPIIKKTKQEVILQDGEEQKTIKIEVATMSSEEKLELVQHLSPLLWWGD